jgi:hypothetical protein
MVCGAHPACLLYSIRAESTRLAGNSGFDSLRPSALAFMFCFSLPVVEHHIAHIRLPPWRFDVSTKPHKPFEIKHSRRVSCALESAARMYSIYPNHSSAHSEACSPPQTNTTSSRACCAAYDWYACDIKRGRCPGVRLRVVSCCGMYFISFLSPPRPNVSEFLPLFLSSLILAAKYLSVVYMCVCSLPH